MLRYNFDRIFRARGIERPFSFLLQAGLSNNFATRVHLNRVNRLDLHMIERLCILLRCTPNDLYEWKADSDNYLSEDHPLNEIRRTDKVVDIAKTLHSVPLSQLPEIEKMIKEKIGKLTAPDSSS